MWNLTGLSWPDSSCDILTMLLALKYLVWSKMTFHLVFKASGCDLGSSVEIDWLWFWKVRPTLDHKDLIWEIWLAIGSITLNHLELHSLFAWIKFLTSSVHPVEEKRVGWNLVQDRTLHIHRYGSTFVEACVSDTLCS